jgi:hypothetical protein
MLPTYLKHGPDLEYPVGYLCSHVPSFNRWQPCHNMPQGYTLHQVSYPQNIQLIAVNKALGVQALPGNQYFAILEDV